MKIISLLLVFVSLWIVGRSFADDSAKLPVLNAKDVLCGQAWRLESLRAGGGKSSAELQAAAARRFKPGHYHLLLRADGSGVELRGALLRREISWSLQQNALSLFKVNEAKAGQAQEAYAQYELVDCSKEKLQLNFTVPGETEQSVELFFIPAVLP